MPSTYRLGLTRPIVTAGYLSLRNRPSIVTEFHLSLRNTASHSDRRPLSLRIYGSGIVYLFQYRGTVEGVVAGASDPGHERRRVEWFEP